MTLRSGDTRSRSRSAAFTDEADNRSAYRALSAGNRACRPLHLTVDLYPPHRPELRADAASLSRATLDRVAPPKKTIKVFIASPGDLAEERRAFKDQIEILNLGFGDGAGVEFIALGWEDTLASTGRRVQSVINADIDTCDVFVLVMHRRWGRPALDSPYSSYTEEELHRALARFQKTGAPRIFVFFKNVDRASIADPGPELSKVLKFRAELERTGTVLYRTFAEPADFRREVDRHLRAFAKGELPDVPVELEGLPLPLESVERVERAEAEARQRAEEAEARVSKQRDAAEAAIQRAKAHEARAEALASALAAQAARAALRGHVEEARRLFAQATVGTTSFQALYLAFEFYRQTGDLSAAEEMMHRWLAAGESNPIATASALGNLGIIHQTRGNLRRAEEMFGKALAIFEQFDHRAGMADQYGNLGVVYKARGDLDLAEEMFSKALKLHEALGRDAELGHDYGNLGLIHQVRGNLVRAEEMSRNALTIYERVRLLPDMAAEYGNLGTIYRRRGELDRAEEMARKALTIYEPMGHLEGMANQYGNLGLIYQERGDLDRAEEMGRKALSICEQTGRLEGVATAYVNIGRTYELRGKLDGARQYVSKARDLFATIGISHRVRQLQEWLDGKQGSPPA